jgi:NAD(P)-dependent dehydrogenase (short-subunit alcohol dehydrogenase family)
MPTYSGEHYRFDDQVVLVTGGSRGLGRAFAKCFAANGARVVINSLGSGDEQNSGLSAAEITRREIVEAGGKAVLCEASVTAADDIVEFCRQRFGRLDAIVHNAGILRDRSFGKLTLDDWQSVHTVHLEAAYKLSHAAWPLFKQQKCGRLLFVSSAAGLYGSFGQANYSAAKLGMVGLAKTLAVEGKAGNIHCNCVAPVAATRMNAGLLDAAVRERLQVEDVAPLVAYLCHPHCTESGSLFEAAGGWFSKVRFERSVGAVLPAGNIEIADIANRWGDITDFSESQAPESLAQSLDAIMKVLT